MESAAEEAVLNRVGLVNVVTHEPVALYLGRGSHIKLLLQNEAHEKNLKGATAVTAEEVNRALADPDFPLREKFLAFVKRLLARQERQTMTFTDNGFYFQLSGEILAGDENLYAGETSVYNLASDERMKKTESLDSLLRRTVSICDELSLYHTEEGTLEVLETTSSLFHPGDQMPAKDTFHRFAERRVHDEDRERFLHFVEPSVLYSLGSEKNRYVPCELFRVRERNGNYVWKELDAYLLDHRGGKDILLMMMGAAIERAWDREAFLNAFVRSFAVAGNSRAEEWRKKPLSFLPSRKRAISNGS